jgi:hypothetical protein
VEASRCLSGEGGGGGGGRSTVRIRGVRNDRAFHIHQGGEDASEAWDVGGRRREGRVKRRMLYGVLERRTSVPGEISFFRGARVGQRLFNACAVDHGVPTHTATLFQPWDQGIETTVLCG